MSTRLIFLLNFFISFGISAQTPEVVLTVGHTDQVNCLSFSHDGKYLLTGGNDMLIKLWDVSTTREIRTFSGNDGRLIAVAFSPDDKYIATLDYSEQVKAWDMNTGKQLCAFPCEESHEYVGFALGKYMLFTDEEYNVVLADPADGSVFKKINIGMNPQRMAVHPDGKKLFYYTYQAEMVELDLESGNELQRVKLFPEFVYMPTRMSFNKSGKLLAASLVDNTIAVFNIEQHSVAGMLKGHTNRIKDICFEKNGEQLFSADHDNNFMLWNVQNFKPVKQEVKTIFGIQYIDTHPDAPIVAFSEFKTVRYVDIESMRSLKEFKAKGNRIISMSYDQQGKYLATAADDISIKVWDLQALKIDKKYQGFFPVEFSPDGKQFVCMGTPAALFVYDPVNGEKKKELSTEMELIQNLNFSADGKLVAGAGFMGIIKIWDVESGKIISKLSGHAGGIYSTAFSPDGKYLASCGLDNTIRIWDLNTGKEIRQMTEHSIVTHDLEFSPDGKLLAVCSWDKSISIWNTSDWSLNKKLEGHINSIYTLSFSPDSKYLASGAGNSTVAAADNSIRVWDVTSGETVCHFKNPTGAISKVIYDRNGELIYSASDDGIAKIWNVKKCTEVAGLISVNASDYVIETPDHFYTASHDALEAVSFRMGNKLFPFEQFDIRLNRPDIVAARIGKTPANLVKAYNYVYQKRLKRLNFKEEDLGTDFHVPEITVKKSSLPFVTTDKKIKFSVRMRDDRYQLNRLMVYVNDVPLFGQQGFELSHLQKQDIEQEVTAELLPGNNKIKVSCINEKGAESLIEEFGIIREGEAEKSNLYVVCVGVSDYQDSRFNLNYAAKDAQDMLDRFASSSSLYKNVYSRLLVNQDATKANILALEEFIKPATTEDIVVVFFAGHGVLDADYEYFFGTYDLNFDHPEQSGVSYEQIENLFSGLKAQRKLLIMDTCHSGELDKDEIEESKAPEVEIKEVKFRAVGAGVRQKESFGVENTFDLMQVLFADVKSGTGTVVISSAGGAEFAMESGSWKNGLFTYCFLSAASDWNADLNTDKHLSVSELRKYTYDKVFRLSEGRQKPTTRSENLALDFFIW